MDVATITVRHFLVVAAKNDRAMPESVLMAPGGIASNDVCRESKPRPLMIKVLNVVSPPFGTWRATYTSKSAYQQRDCLTSG